jgi:hypothetical protein
MNMLHLHKYLYKLCSCVLFNYMLQSFRVELKPKAAGNVYLNL